MKTRLFGFALATTMLVSTSAALAADMPGPPPVDNLRGSYDWSGAYIGIVGGLACLGGNGYLTDNKTAGHPTYDLGGCGGKAGVTAGYNYQMDNIVLGVEGDYMWGKDNWIRRNGNTSDFGIDLDGFGTLRARAGWAVDRTLLFVTGGAAYARATLHGVNGAALPDPITKGQWGWTIGGGVEQAVTDNFHLRLDYLYAHLGSKDYNQGCCQTNIKWGGEHEVRVGATWNFGGMW